MKKSVFLFLGVAAILLASCATGGGGSAQDGIPPEIRDWIDKNGEQEVYAMGISDLPDEMDAYQQALVRARENLAAAIEDSSSRNAKQDANESDNRRARFIDMGPEHITPDPTMPKPKIYGPYINGKKTYIIVYLSKQEFEILVNFTPVTPPEYGVARFRSD